MLKTLKYLTLALIALAVLVLIWGLAEPYFIDIRAHTVSIPNLPASWQGQRVAVIGDFQVGMWLDNLPTVRRIVDRLVQEKPAAVLILGDFIYKGGEQATGRIRQAATLVEPLTRAGIPVYAVLGNHDYSVTSSEDPDVDHRRAQKMAAALESLGVRMLANEAVPVTTVSGQSGEAPLYLVGIGAHMPGMDEPEVTASLLPADAARLVIMHNPDSFAEVPANTAPLAIAGHTHGGQLRLPFTPTWSYLTYLREDQVHVDGWIQDYGQPGNRLYVNRGIGFSILPMRINCPPEITYFTLTRPSSAKAPSLSPSFYPFPNESKPVAISKSPSLPVSRSPLSPQNVVY